MNDLNNGTLVCRLTKDSEISYLQSGSAKLDFSVAFSTSKKVGNEWKNETNFLNNLVLWGKTAENLSPYLKKGQMVGLQYHLHVDSYEKDGKKVSVLKTVIDDIQLLGSSGNKSETKPQQTQQPEQQSFPEDVPF